MHDQTSVTLLSRINAIRYFLMLVVTGSFSPERGLPANVCVDFNHFQSIVMGALVDSKTLEFSFLNNFRLLSHMLPTKINLLKSSLGICCLKMIKMYRQLDRKSPFTYAATWWSSTSERSECLPRHTTSLQELYLPNTKPWMRQVEWIGSQCNFSIILSKQSLGHMNNDMVRSYRDVIVITKFATRRTSKAQSIVIY